MLRRMFFLVFCLFLCVTLTHTTKGARGEDDMANVVHTLLGGGKTGLSTFKAEVDVEKEEIKIDSFRSPALIEAEKMVVLVAEAHYKNKSEKYAGIVSVTMRSDGTLGQINAVMQDRTSEKILPFMLRPTVIAEESEITAIFGGHCRDAQPLKKEYTSGCSWEPRMLTSNFAYEISRKTETKYYEWQGETRRVTDVFEDSNFFAYLNSKDIEEFIVSGGAGILMENDRYALPVQALQKNDKTIVSLIITLKNSVEDWKFFDGRSAVGCTNPAVLELKTNELLMITSCESGHYKVYQLDNEGENWAVVESLSGVWGTNKQRNGPGFRGGFIKAEIDGTNVVLFTQPVEDNNRNIYSLHLWVTDMKHIYNLGLISAPGKDVSASSLLYKKPNTFVENGEKEEKLYCAYEVNDGGSNYDIVVTDLADKLKQIKNVVKKWEEVDEKVVKRFCISPQTTGDVPVTECEDFEITEGLVGYLSLESLKDNGKWDDEYLCVNTTASPKARGDDSGSHSAAGNEFRWPANSDNQNQLYHFANKAFTLVATVMINAEPNEKVSLLGVVFKNLKERDSEKKYYELSYRKDDRWLSVTNGQEKKHTDKWIAGEQHQVVLSRKGTTFHVYVDGKLLEEVDGTIMGMETEGSFSHFFFGAYGTENSKDVTVTNVLLYNRHLNVDEITKSIKKETVLLAKPEEKNKENAQQSLAPSPAAPTKTVLSANPSVTIPEASALPKLQHLPSKNNEGNLHQTNYGNKEVVENGIAHQQQTKMSDGLNPSIAEKKTKLKRKKKRCTCNKHGTTKR